MSWAKTPTCESQKISFKGEITWKTRNKKTKKIEDHSSYQPIPPVWNSSSGEFKTIRIITKLPIDGLRIDILKQLKEKAKDSFKVKKISDELYESKRLKLHIKLQMARPGEELAIYPIKDKKKLCLYKIKIQKTE